MSSNQTIGTVYLLHFDKALGHAKHYIGWTGNLEQRMHEHRHNNNGSSILQAARKQGITFEVVKTWENVDRNFERKLKNRKNSKNLCPICRAMKEGDAG